MRFYSMFFLILILISCSNDKNKNKVTDIIGANALSVAFSENQELNIVLDKVYSYANYNDKTFTEPYKKINRVDSLTKEIISEIESYSLVDGNSKVLVEMVNNYLNSVQTITNSKYEELLNIESFININDLDTCLNIADPKFQLPIVFRLLKLQILKYQGVNTVALLNDWGKAGFIGIENNSIVNLNLDSCSVLSGNDLTGEVYLAGYNSKCSPVVRIGEVNTELFTKKNQLSFNSIHDLQGLFIDGKYEELPIINGKGIINMKAENKGVNFLEGVIINRNLGEVIVTYFKKDYLVN